MTMADRSCEIALGKWMEFGGIRPYYRPDGIPTRIDSKWHTPAEAAIIAAMVAVERHPGGSPALTEAVTLLARARDRVADHVEGKTE
jgi:hypothetical protein